MYGIAIGVDSGFQSQGRDGIAIGRNAGEFNQGRESIAIGYYEGGQTGQGIASVAIGKDSARIDQSDYSVAIGLNAGEINQGSSTVAIGFNAGQTNQGNNSIAIGNRAGRNNQISNSIILNASGQDLNTTTGGFYVSSLEQSVVGDQGNVVAYNPTTSEVYMVSGKTFVIDHPNDNDKYLVHACLEGPEGGVYYRGTSQVVNGSATVSLPDYVDSLATDLTVQLTPIFNGSIPHICTTRVVNGKFSVHGDDCEFDWLVMGKRGDIQVEPLKKESQVMGDGPYTWIHN